MDYPFFTDLIPPLHVVGGKEWTPDLLSGCRECRLGAGIGWGGELV